MALVFILAFLFYIPSLNNYFVNWDDPIFVKNHPQIQAMDISWMLTSLHSANWVPLALFSHAIDFAIWGTNPMGHHLTSILFHAIDSTLVFVLVVILTGVSNNSEIDAKAIIGGLVAAILFALHPVHVESVSWIAERRDVLSAFFFILSIICYIKYASGNKVFQYLLSILFFALAIMSKPMAVTLPVVLLMLDFYPLERFPKKLPKWQVLAEKIPFFIISIITSLIAVWTQKNSDALSSLDVFPFIERALVAVRAIAFYLYKTVLPFDLLPYYDRPQTIGLSNYEFIAAFALVVAITIFSIITAIRGRKIFLAVWLYFWVTLLPVIGLVQVGRQAAADRYMYLPSLGLFILVGVGCAACFLTFSGYKKYIFSGVVVIAILCLGALTVRQQAIWKDSVTLWTYQIEKDPNGGFSRVLAHSNRGVTYLAMKEYGKAIEDYSVVISLQPYYARAYMQRGRALMGAGRGLAALKDFDVAAALSPSNQEIQQYRNTAIRQAGYGKISN